MKILYDFRAYQVYNQRGIARYVFHIFGSAIRQSKEPAYILLFENGIRPDFPTDMLSRIKFLFLEDFERGQYADERFDVFINGAHFLPTLSAENAVSTQYPEPVMCVSRKKACIVFDFIPLFFQQYIPNEDAKISFALQTEALRYLDHIFTDSMFTLYSCVRYLDRPVADFTCLYGGADEKKFMTENSLRPYNAAARKNHLIYISGAAPQKNTEGFVRAFCKAYRRGKLPKDAKLYIVCRANKEFIGAIRYETERSGCKYKKQVVATDYISDEEMIELLSTARSSIFPSFYEGLGLPILESYAAGTPCWASGASATQECVLPECSFDPFDEESMIQAAAAIYQDEELCKRSLEFGRGLLATMSWDAGARKMLDKCKELCKEKL